MLCCFAEVNLLTFLGAVYIKKMNFRFSTRIEFLLGGLKTQKSLHSEVKTSNVIR